MEDTVLILNPVSKIWLLYYAFSVYGPVWPRFPFVQVASGTTNQGLDEQDPIKVWLGT